MPLMLGSLAGQLGHRVGCRAVVVHRHGHHLDAEPVQQGEVPVVAGHRADEPDLLLLSPGPLAVHGALEPQVGEDLAHHHQAGAAAGDDLLGLDPQQVGEHGAQLGDALQAAVVAGVDAGLVDHAAGQVQQLVGEVQLGGRGLAAREVELEPLGRQLVVRRPRLGEELGQLLGGTFGQGRPLAKMEIEPARSQKMSRRSSFQTGAKARSSHSSRLPRRLPVWWFPTGFAMPSPG